MNPSYLFLFLSVAIGAVIVEIFKPNKGKNIQLLLTFSGAYLLAVSTLHLIPELFANNPSEKIGIFILAGFLIQILLEFFSKGIEHGHFHKKNVIPITVMISLCLHALLEGIPLGGGMSESSEQALLMGIVLHKAPVSMVLLSLFLQSGMSKLKSYIAEVTLNGVWGPSWIGTEPSKFRILDLNSTIFCFSRKLDRKFSPTHRRSSESDV